MHHDNVQHHNTRSLALLILSLLSALLMEPALAAPAGDTVRGKQVFAQCSACHAVAPGQNHIGPSLAGVVGRPAASMSGYTYSAAMKASHIIWTEPVLSAYLEAPRKLVAGTKMGYAGLADAQKRADVIAYLKARPAS